MGDTYTVHGSGFEPGSWVPLEIAEADGCCLALGMVADECGSFSVPVSRGRRALSRAGIRPAQRERALATVASWSFEAYP